MDVYNPEYLRKHCEIVAFLVSRNDKKHPSVKHHIRSAIREASNHVGFSPGSSKQSARFMSAFALDAMKNGRDLKLIAEHVVPVSVLNQLVLGIDEPTPENIERLLRAYGMRAVITEGEHETLRSLGLHKKMPGAVDEERLFSRYQTAGIELVENRYSELMKLRKMRG
ncbi:hypothetical protein [Marinobacter sp. BGYM27]|uniref:hypothetical protein n=1 Tax=Marinobacter sp. BGYM27 TaxID=2975597 RepID=UPI0021A72C1C|nr:hypothetical protein [Marinobacter sp. BGYM27]MDG5499760.1 hypothetical protein [Marinobacter sp. BGYM27]